MRTRRQWLFNECAQLWHWLKFGIDIGVVYKTEERIEIGMFIH